MSVDARLAVLESRTETMENDLKEVKADVKSLLLARAGGEARSALGKFLIPAVALVVSVAAFLKGG